LRVSFVFHSSPFVCLLVLENFFLFVLSVWRLRHGIT
jgi:hypothetical protein